MVAGGRGALLAASAGAEVFECVVCLGGEASSSKNSFLGEAACWWEIEGLEED